MEITKETNLYPVSRLEFETIIKQTILPVEINNYYAHLDKAINEVGEFYDSNDVIRFDDKDFCYVKSLVALVPCFEKEQVRNAIDFDFDSITESLNESLNFECNTDNELPSPKNLQSLQSYLSNYETGFSYMLCLQDDGRTKTNGKVVAVNIRTLSTAELEEVAIEETGYFPINKFKSMDKNRFIGEMVLKNNWIPEGLSNEIKNVLRDIFVLLNEKNNYLAYERKLNFYGVKLANDLIEKRNINECFSKLSWPFPSTLDQIFASKVFGIANYSKVDYLLNCEKQRAAIDPYEERILTDPNRGHWDLWEENEDYHIATNVKLMARNPKCDVNYNGVIAIDFGTKSTVVVYQNEIEHSLPMGIGDGALSKAPTKKRYENPTVMQFVNLERFLQAYKSKDGRPETNWEDLLISHAAIDKFAVSSSEQYYSFLQQIKQWAGNRKKQFKIQPISGESITLPAFMDLKDTDINPIELYAYYIGLFINNMRKGHGIYLDYYLSFPVTYETQTREKIRSSFEKGLKKSLPNSIQKDAEIMENFKVNGSISEPAAYAACALQEYGFDPKDGEEVFYGIFDFGGGTTDFDFGLWKKSKKRRYDYRLENFGAGGDAYLGGENLLEMLAFEIFKKNQDMMRENGFDFTLAPKCTEFLGSDSLLADSQEAEKNMHNLMEKLRPYWEIEQNIPEDNQEHDVSDEIVNKEFVIKQLLAFTKRFNDTQYESITKSVANKFINQINEITHLTYPQIDVIEESFNNWLHNNINNPASFKFDKSFSSSKEIDQDFVLKVDLFNKNGEMKPAVEINVSQGFINDFIEGQIREGVKNFFSALILSYQSDSIKKPTKVNILLAGNSCKSPIVTKMFMEEINKHEEKMKSLYDFDGSESVFEIFPPLGTDAAYKKMEERGLQTYPDDFEKPTGKTGVAFGLLQCRNGGTVERVFKVNESSEIPFQYFIGWKEKGKFVVFKDDEQLMSLLGKPDYNTWYNFIDASEDTFYLYYTTLPECVEGNLMIDGNSAVKRVKCVIDTVSEDANVYIRAVSPHTIEYVVSNSKDVDKDKLGKIIVKELD